MKKAGKRNYAEETFSGHLFAILKLQVGGTEKLKIGTKNGTVGI